MAAANSKRKCENESLWSFRRSGMQAQNLKTGLFLPCVICFLFTVGYTSLRYGEIMKVCEEQHLMKTRFPSQFMELFWSFLHWSGIQQTKTDLSNDAMVLCNENFFSILLFIVKVKIPEDSYCILCLIKNAVEEKLQVLTLYCKCIIEQSLMPSLFVRSSHETLVCACLCLVIGILITVMIRKFIWRQKNLSPNSPLNSSANRKYGAQFAQSTLYSRMGCETLQHGPISVDVTQKCKKLEDGQSQQKCFSYAFLIQWIFVMVSAALFLSIPWEFMRLYQKAVSSRAAKVVKGLPPQCTQTSLSWLESFQFLLQWHFSWSHSHDVCQEYYYASLVDPLWDVNPLLVISSVLTQGILHPLEMTCLSLGRSLRAFFSEIPIQWQPFIMLLAVVMAMVFLLMICRYRLSIPLFLKIEPRTPVTSPSERERSRTKSYRCTDSLDYADFSLNDDYVSQINVSDKYNINDTIPSSRKYSFIPGYSISPLSNQKQSSPKLSIQSRTDLANGSSTSHDVSSRHTYLSHDERERNSSKLNEKIPFLTSRSENKSQETPRKKQNKKRK